MKIKQTIKRLSTPLLAVFMFAMVLGGTTPVNAASCGGVDTAILSCGQSGTCTGGVNPYEGTKPITDGEKTAYTKTYKHDYGFCDTNGTAPIKNVSDNGVWGVLLLVINILTGGIAIAAVGGIVYGSILYTTAGGSPEQVKKAMGIITNVVIGVVAYALMFSGLNFLIPGGIFN